MQIPALRCGMTSKRNAGSFAALRNDKQEGAERNAGSSALLRNDKQEKQQENE
jgi:hypothetical protein